MTAHQPQIIPKIQRRTSKEEITISTQQALIGSTSEYVAIAVLQKHGWAVNKPCGVESYDLVALDPSDGKMKRLQVKTVKRRKDRNNCLVISGRKSNGSVYTKGEADMIVGVYGNMIYLIDNELQSQYQAIDPEVAANKWRTLTLEGEGAKEVVPV